MKKKWIILWPIPVVLAFLFYCDLSFERKRKLFHENKIESLVVKRSYNCSHGTTFDYECKSGDIVVLLNSDTLLLGDSIVKMANSDYFDVYRSNNEGSFKYLKRFSIPD